MAKLFKAIKLEELRKAKKLKDAKLTNLMDDNSEPIRAVHDAAKKLHALQPYTTGDPVRDIVGINAQLNYLPDHFDKCNEKQLREAWEGAEKAGRATAWIKGHIILTLNRKYKDEAVRKFAEEMGLSPKTIYNYMHLAELFPKVDPILDPSFHFKAIAMSHGDKDKAIKLIEKAKEKRMEDPSYSVRDFVEESADGKKQKNAKPVPAAKSLVERILKDLQILSKHVELSDCRDNFKEVNKFVERINLLLKKTAAG